MQAVETRENTKPTAPSNEDSKTIEDHFDQVQEQLETLTSMDNLLSGTLHP